MHLVFSFVTYELTLGLLGVQQQGSLRLDFGAYEYIKDDVYGLVKCVKCTASLTMVFSHCVNVVKAVWYFLQDVRIKCVVISLYLRFGCFNKRITGMSDNAKPGATQCLLPVLNDSIVWCTMKGLCHVFFAFVMLLCDLVVPDILEYCTNVRYWVWCLPCWTNNA